MLGIEARHSGAFEEMMKDPSAVELNHLWQIGLLRILAAAALLCGCALAVFPQAVPSQGADESKDGTHYLRDVVVEKVGRFGFARAKLAHELSVSHS